MREAQNIEWKQYKRDEYLQCICAFANTEGGSLIIGKDKGKSVKLDNLRKLLEGLPAGIKSQLVIISAVKLIEADTSWPYIEIVTHSYTNPISYKGKFYLRSESTTHELNGAERTDFLLTKSGKTWDEFIVDEASIADIGDNN